MVNNKGAPKKYKDAPSRNIGLFISEPFRPYFNEFIKIVDTEDSIEFKNYCKNVEEVDLSKKNGGKRTLLIRFLITQYVIKRRLNARREESEGTNNSEDQEKSNNEIE